MTVRLLPDVEELLVAFHLDQAEILAFFADDTPHDRVYSVLPKEKVFPLLRITRFGGTPRFDRPLYLDQPTVQIDAFGGPKKLAFQLAETSRAVMARRLVGTHATGVVTAVRFGALAYAPDDEFAPARPRYLYTATITTHPLPDSGS